MLCVTGLFLRDITNMIFFSCPLEYELLEHLLFFFFFLLLLNLEAVVNDEEINLSYWQFITVEQTGVDFDFICL